MRRDREPPTPDALWPAATCSRRGRVLLVDDEPVIGRTLVRLLARDHDAAFFVDPREALARIAQGGPLDVLFCDLMMPAMNGADFFRALRAARPELAPRVVFLSGGAFTGRADSFLQSTPNPSLNKPVEVATLRRVIAAYVNEPR